MNVLVIGGTGTVGSQVVQALRTRDADIGVLTRDAEKARKLPQGVRSVTGDLLDPGSVRSIFDEVDRVFLLVPVSPSETHAGLFAVNGARLAGVKRIVYVSVQNADQAVHLPHFGSKVPIELAIRASGVPYTILRPNNFFQNDCVYKDVLLQQGVYPQPIGSLGLSRVDVRDIAEAAATVLMEDGHEGETYNVVGPEVHTGQSTAEVWSRALGKKISYAGDDLDAWERQFLEFLPAWMVFDFKLMYAFLQEKGLQATSADLEHMRTLLGRSPGSFEDFAGETAEAWKAHG
jgi:uncharacterized protein YbjT (DUF2867 family)